MGEHIPCTDKVAGSIPVASTTLKEKNVLERVISVKMANMYLKKDTVRPCINGEVRLAPGRQMYHINEEAFLCSVYLDRVPDSEVQLLTCDVGPIVVAYTVWSLKKGMGRTIILEALKMIQDTCSYYPQAPRFKRFVTLSPKTDMATKFHLSNGACLIRETPWANNFEYSLKK